MIFGVVVGMAAEARIAVRFGGPVQVGGGTPEGAERAARRLIEQGANALVSFGFAGGLDPALRAGMVVIPTAVLFEDRMFPADPALAARFGGLTPHWLLAGTTVAADAITKRRLHIATHAHAIDLESGTVARIAEAHDVPFAAVRAISDPAGRDLPPAALVSLDRHGNVNLIRVIKSLLMQPRQLPGLLRLASDAARAQRALIELTRLGNAPGH